MTRVDSAWMSLCFEVSEAFCYAVFLLNLGVKAELELCFISCCGIGRLVDLGCISAAYCTLCDSCLVFEVDVIMIRLIYVGMIGLFLLIDYSFDMSPLI